MWVGGLRRPPAARLKIRTDLRQPDRRNTREGMRSQFRGYQGWLVLFLVSLILISIFFGRGSLTLALSVLVQDGGACQRGTQKKKKSRGHATPNMSNFPSHPLLLIIIKVDEKKVWHCL